MTTRLIASDCNLVYRGKAYETLPILLLDGLVVFEASYWFLWLTVQSRRPTTVWSYAEAIELWFRSLHASGIDWRDVTKHDMVDWRDAQVDASLAPATIVKRMTAVQQFYLWAVDEGLIEKLPFQAIPRGRSALRNEAAVRSRNAASSNGGFTAPHVTMSNVPHRRKKWFTLEQFGNIRRAAAEQHKDPWLKERDDLIFRWGWSTGLRGMEIVGLTVDALQNAYERGVLDGVIVLDLVPERTKGAKGGQILVPRNLAKRTLEYIKFGRAEIVERARSKRKGYHAPPEIFLARQGTAIPRATASKYFKCAARKAGVEGSLHGTRHSFATRLLQAAADLGVDGTLIGKELLRHADERTFAIYQHINETKDRRVASALLVNRMDEGVAGGEDD